jgi:hypothetical protein
VGKGPHLAWIDDRHQGSHQAGFQSPGGFDHNQRGRQGPQLRHNLVEPTGSYATCQGAAVP